MVPFLRCSFLSLLSVCHLTTLSGWPSSSFINMRTASPRLTYTLSNIFLTELAKTRDDKGQHRTNGTDVSCCSHYSLVSGIVRCSVDANSS